MAKWSSYIFVQKMKIGETIGILHLFVWNYVKYANM